MSVMLVTFFLMHLAFNTVYCPRFSGKGPYKAYSLQDSYGIGIREKLAKDLKNECQHCPSKIRQAAATFTNYIMGEVASQYIEAFFVNIRPPAHAFRNLLNGFVQDGDPTVKAWQAALVLLKYIKDNNDKPFSTFGAVKSKGRPILKKRQGNSFRNLLKRSLLLKGSLMNSSAINTSPKNLASMLYFKKGTPSGK